VRALLRVVVRNQDDPQKGRHEPKSQEGGGRALHVGPRPTTNGADVARNPARALGRDNGPVKIEIQRQRRKVTQAITGKKLCLVGGKSACFGEAIDCAHG
jgi:hypothetical protein